MLNTARPMDSNGGLICIVRSNKMQKWSLNFFASIFFSFSDISLTTSLTDNYNYKLACG